MEIRNIDSPEHLKAVIPIILELRTHLNEEEAITIINEAKKMSGYTLLGVFKKETCQALMGYRILTDLVHGKHLYIDDLIVSKDHQLKGIGKTFLTHAESIAQKENCDRLRLCTGKDNVEGRQFYDKVGWDLRAIVYKKKL